jgi:hypothetical protein
MALTVTDMEIMQAYLEGVMDRAAHHAGNVEMTKSGDAKNVLWVSINKQRYAFSYNHEAKEIEMRLKSTHGAVLHTFSNKTSLTSIKSIFAAL